MCVIGACHLLMFVLMDSYISDIINVLNAEFFIHFPHSLNSRGQKLKMLYL